MTLTLITAPAAEPVGLNDLKMYHGVEHSEDDTLLVALSAAAREFVEAATGFAFMASTWEITARNLAVQVSAGGKSLGRFGAGPAWAHSRASRQVLGRGVETTSVLGTARPISDGSNGPNSSRL
jgi:hypothetical protein